MNTQAILDNPEEVIKEILAEHLVLFGGRIFGIQALIDKLVEQILTAQEGESEDWTTIVIPGSVITMWNRKLTPEEITALSEAFGVEYDQLPTPPKE